MMIRMAPAGDMVDGGRRKRSRAHAALPVWVFCVLCAWLTPALAGERGAVGDLYVVNNLGHNILQYDGWTGEYVGQFVTVGSGGLDGPADMTWGPNGNLFVAETDPDSGKKGNILEYDGQTGDFVRVFVKGGEHGMEAPHGLAFGGPDGDLYVVCTIVDGVFVFDGVSGEFERILVKPIEKYGLRDPRTPKFGPNGNLFITDETSFRPTMYEFDPRTGELVRIVIRTVGASKMGFIYEPKRVTWLLAENSNWAIERFDYRTGEPIEVIVRGTGEMFSLKGPRDMAWSPNGNLFVAGNKTRIPLPGFPGGRDFGALHEYDGDTYEEVQVFGYMTTYEKGMADNAVFYPRQLEFKPLPGDYGGDHAGGDWDVDLADVGRFMNAFTGAGVRSNDALALTAFDTDRDGDIDLDDYPAFSEAITGPK